MDDHLILLLLKGVSALVLLVIALVGGLLPLCLQGAVDEASKAQSFMRTGNALAGGILLAAALVHMLPDAAENLEELGVQLKHWFRPGADGAFPLAPTVAGLFFLAIALMEVSLKRLTLHEVESLHEKEAAEEEGEYIAFEASPLEKTRTWPAAGSPPRNLAADSSQKPMSRLYQRTSVECVAVKLQDRSNSAAGAFLLLMLAIHSLLEGISIGAQVHSATFLSIFLAVSAHKGLAAFALGSKLLGDSPAENRSNLYRGIFLFGICSPLGIMGGAYLVDEVKGAGVGIVLSAATGTFLYISIPELLLPAFEGAKSSRSATTAAVFGFAFMAFLAMWV